MSKKSKRKPLPNRDESLETAPRRLSDEEVASLLEHVSCTCHQALPGAWKVGLEYKNHDLIIVDAVFLADEGRFIIRSTKSEHFEIDSYNGFHVAYELASNNGFAMGSRGAIMTPEGPAMKRRGRPPKPELREELAEAERSGMSLSEAARRKGKAPCALRVYKHRLKLKSKPPSGGVT